MGAADQPARFLFLMKIFRNLAAVLLLASHLPAADPVILKDEPLLFIGDTKATATARLLHVPQAAPKLISGDRSINFEVGKDFIWEAGSRELKLTADSKIPFKTPTELYPPANSPNAYSAQRGTGQWMFFGPGRVLHELQPVASYTANDDWQPPQTPAAPDAQLVGLRKALQAKQPINIVMLGDSISTGLDASAGADVAPRQPGYPELVAKGLETSFGSKCTLRNLSKSGMDANWGLSKMPEVLAAKPDLFLLAFGMNDASGKRTPAEFSRITQEIINALKAALPNCSIILISPMTANPEWSKSSPELYPAYAEALGKLTGPGIAMANVTTIWTALAERKKYMDLSGNGLNHPNDYGHRIYAGVVLETIGGKAR